MQWNEARAILITDRQMKQKIFNVAQSKLVQFSGKCWAYTRELGYFHGVNPLGAIKPNNAWNFTHRLNHLG